MKRLGRKSITVTPMTYGEFCKLHNIPMTPSTFADQPGFEVVEPDGCKVWLPEDHFHYRYEGDIE